MKIINKVLIVAFILIGVAVKAQISVQTVPEATINQENPFLDASKYNNFSPNVGKGLYFPRTNLTTWEFNTNTISVGLFSSYFDGMVVYNTATGQTIADPSKGGIQVEVTPGFYYFNNPNATAPGGSVATGKWERILSAENTSMGEPWQVSGTTDPANSNTQDIYQMGKVGVGTTTPKTELDVVGEIRSGLSDESAITTIDESSISMERNTKSSGILTTREWDIQNDSDNLLKVHFKSGQSTISRGASTSANLTAVSISPFAPTGLGTSTTETSFGGRVRIGDTNHSTLGTEETLTVIGTAQLTGMINSTDNTDKIVVANSDGVLKTKSSTLLKGSWQVSGTTDPANSNTQDIYQMGKVGVGTTTPKTELDVVGEIRSGLSDESAITTIDESSISMERNTKSGGILTTREWDIQNDSDNLLKINFKSEQSTISRGASTSANLTAVSITPFAPTGLGTSTTETSFGGRVRIGDTNHSTLGTEETLTVTGTALITSYVGIGVISPTEKLEVDGNVKANSFISATTTYPDYVFENYYKGFSKLNNNYTFKALPEVEAFIKENGHLPGYKPASEIIKKGSFNISESHLMNVEKIEELYLHTIEQDKKIKTQQKEIEELKTMVKQLLKQSHKTKE